MVAVLILLVLIGIVYMLKKKFSERINNFFAEEIERSKTQLALGETNYKSSNRFSLTSNLALNLGGTNQPNIRHSHSSIICKLNNCKQRYRLGGSDTECKTYSNFLTNKDLLTEPQRKDGYFSDTDAMRNKPECATHRKRFPALLFFSQKIVNSTSTVPLNDNSNSLLKPQAANRSFEKPRRYSLYDFVIRRQSNQGNSSSGGGGLFGGFEHGLKQATNKLTRSKKKKHKLISAHKSKSSTENEDNHLRISGIPIENVRAKFSYKY